MQQSRFEVILINARHLKNVKGKKTDVVDSKWIQMLHSLGLLEASFQPDNFTEEIRTYTRHRKSLIDTSSRYITKMNQALTLMNIQVGTVIADLSGKSGQSIIKAILAGERDAKKMAALADIRVKASPETIEKSLVGNWREEHLFELQQSYDLYHFYWEKIRECDSKIEKLLVQSVLGTTVEVTSYKSLKKKKKNKNDPGFKVEKYAYQLTGGIDLMAIDGVNVSTILSLISEIGKDLSKFPSAKHFSSWLRLAPNNKKTGGKVIKSHTPKKKNNFALALMSAANAIGLGKGPLSGFFKKITLKKGRVAAIIATARKLSVIIYNMLVNKQQFNYQLANPQLSERDNKLSHIKRQMKKWNISQEELSIVRF